MKRIKHQLFISSNALKGGPNSFTKNLINSLEYFDDFELNKNLFSCDSVLLIGENYRIKDLILGLLNKKKIVYRLDGRRFSFLSSVRFKRRRGKSIIEFLKAMCFEVKVISAYFFSTKVVYQSNFTRKQFNFIEGFLKKKYQVILNPISTSDLRNNPIDLNTKHSLPIDKYVIISKGYFHQSEFLNVAYKVLINLGIKIYVFGSYKSDSLKKYPLIKFFGYLNSPAYKVYLNNCFVYLCVEDFACCPNALIEAQYFGKPIIGPNNGSLPEMCPSPKMQLLNYDSNIENKLKEILNEYIKNYDYWVRKSFQFSKNKFGIKQYKDYCNLFSDKD